VKPYNRIEAPPGVDPTWWERNEEYNALLVENTMLREQLNHPAIEFVRQAHRRGHKIVELISPQEAGAGNGPHPKGVQYAGYYCRDYDGPVLA
jgi:hypothetical protein